MAKQLILISPPGEQLVIDMAAGTVESVLTAPDDAETYLIVGPSTSSLAESAAQPPTEGVKPKKPPLPPPDIGAFMLVGKPIPPTWVATETAKGPQAFTTLGDRFAAMSEDEVIAITLGPLDSG
jgi:hypothetical protein